MHMDLSDASTVSKDLGAQLEKVIQYNGARPVATLPNWCLVRVDTCSIVDLKTVKKKKKENKIQYKTIVSASKASQT